MSWSYSSWRSEGRTEWLSGQKRWVGDGERSIGGWDLREG